MEHSPESEGIGNDLHISGALIYEPFSESLVPGEMAIRNGVVEEVAYGERIPVHGRRGLERIDGSGSVISPAFLDGHMHMYQWSISRQAVDLSSVRTLKEIRDRFSDIILGRERNQFFEKTGLLFGVDLDESKLTDGVKLARGALDGISKDHPILIRRICGHKVYLNSPAIDKFDIRTEASADGILVEGPAMALSWGGNLGNDILLSCLEQGISLMYRMGFAGGVEILPLSKLHQFKKLLNSIDLEPKLSLSIYKDIDIDLPCGPPETSFDKGSKRERDPKPVFMKFFMDGSIGSRTASFFHPYSDSPAFEPLVSNAELSKRLEEAREHNLIPMVHAIGDRAVANAVKVCSGTGYPYRLEHCESMDRKIVKKVEASSGGVCMQPNFQWLWGSNGGMYNQALGQPGSGLNPLSTLCKNSTRWCFGTDMMPPGFQTAAMGGLNHADPSNRISLVDLIKGFTSNSSVMSLLGPYGDIRETIGCFSDMVLIDIRDLSVKLSMIHGRIRYYEV
ncbi:MAG: amidohydrolase family protein [Thermoplasmatota archaeon]